MRPLMKFLLIVLMLVISPLPAQALPGEVVKWAAPPRDVYLHSGSTALCSSVASDKLRNELGPGRVLPYLLAALICAGAGAVKEELVDEYRSSREYRINGYGIISGLLLTFTFN